MAPRILATALALNRLAFGVGFLASPSLARSWIGRRTAEAPRAQVFTRALGAWEVAFALVALVALRRGEDPHASR